jgi:hypothetical protein
MSAAREEIKALAIQRAAAFICPSNAQGLTWRRITASLPVSSPGLRFPVLIFEQYMNIGEAGVVNVGGKGSTNEIKTSDH